MRARLVLLLLLLVSVGCATPEPEPSSPVSPTSQPSPQAETVKIFLSRPGTGDCADVVAVEREVGGRNTLRNGMEQLLTGPTDQEKAAGLGGWFSESTADMLISAEREGDVARVDFRDLREVIPNASSSCGSAGLLAQLDSTAKQFGATQTLYSINGDLDTFYNWLQLSTPEA
ncbi:hypothetical protein BH23ACT12_BH23ACT12_06680 [soil metagenome]